MLWSKDLIVGTCMQNLRNMVQVLQVNHETYFKISLRILYFFIWINITRITCVFVSTMLIHSGSKCVRFLYIIALKSYVMNYSSSLFDLTVCVRIFSFSFFSIRYPLHPDPYNLLHNYVQPSL